MKAKTIEKFSGFTPETFRFFNDLKENNYKPWFDEHKPVYELEVRQPLKALVLALTPAFYAIDPQMNFNPSKIISRIYRDIRFSNDKSPYKTHLWFTFQRIVQQWENFPGFYGEISENGYQYGMGLFMAKKKVMDDFRSKIEYDSEHFKAITEDLIGKHGYIIGGEPYKRPLNNDLPEYFQAWIQVKSLYLYKNFPVGEEMFREDFAQRLADEFTLLQPLYDFMVDVCD
ncbi:TIGR02453 family protein [Bacteroidia bacterium]|nr:TIGR02453 family protein [Bacteroidia bacterium]